MWCKIIIFFVENQENFLFFVRNSCFFVCVNTKTALSLDCKNAAFSYKL